MQRTLLAKLRRLFLSRAPSARDDADPLPKVGNARRAPPPIPSDAILELDSGVFTIEVEHRR